ncbi:MAG: glucosamine-6-phosphate deaminase [Nanoarchaeota archaeon]|nr:glucosamine-6-phosphate deaminase [Nanoarchaeota archaeon]MBU1270329.1 glucosamine-6-phosphate deaminase [Nanoarchaeota archaeon]MBU1604326.1 glucosamine-6-phosphate deaminase [Nanoarchaeota archaeon]MBU2443569.1 glucosamine-6-phosphate deaminase [Nanoarchaeota archaeon]
MRIIKAKDYDNMSAKAATIIANEIMLNPTITIGFATGNTMLGLYKSLAKMHSDLGVDFSKITTFNLDEYHPIKKDNKNSYHQFMFENLFNHININRQNINLLNGSTKDPTAECKNYESKIRNNGIDIQLLGIGINGHIGFNEPGSSFNSKTRLIELDETTINENSKYFKNKKDVPKQALTIGISTIMSAKKILLLANGKKKAEALKKMLQGPVTEDCPASILQRHPEVVVIVDDEAASLLDMESIPKEICGYKIISDDNLPKNKKIAVISPHPDDSCIGPGGTMALLSDKNDIHTIIMTTGYRAFIPNTTKEERIDIREHEVIEESRILNSTPHFLKLEFYDSGKEPLDEDIEKVFKKLKELDPDIVVLPQKNDLHSTHKKSRDITLEALKRLKKSVELWSYESPWGLFNKGDFNMITSIPENRFQKKLEAIKSHKTQVERTNYVTVAESLAKLRGALIPEQELFGFGSNKKINPHIELFYAEEFKK